MNRKCFKGLHGGAAGKITWVLVVKSNMQKKWRIEGWVDCHCHLTDARILPHRDGMLERAKSAGIQTFFAGGVDPQDWDAQQNLSNKVNLWASFGLHPYWVTSHSREEFEQAFFRLEQKLPQALALGEIGLDFRGEVSKGQDEWQREAFHRLWELGCKQKKVMVLHLVKAHGEKPFPSSPRPAIVHAFNSGADTARHYLDQGFYLSIGGPLLRVNNQALNDAVRHMPLERILVESDSPDQGPPQYKNQLNEPASILLVAERIGALKGLGTEEVLRAVNANLRVLFEEVE